MNKQFAKIKEIISGLPAWLVIALIGCIVVIESIAFLFPAPVEFPMDDAYIHFVYADNLVAQGRLFFNDVNETGIGATSPLWIFLLAGLKLLGIPLPIAAKVMGAIGLIIVSGGIYVLFRPVWKSPSLLLAMFLVSISGNLIWFSLSGMETVLFLALGILALMAYRSERWILLGIFLGMLTLTRPEGIILIGAIECVDLWAHRRIRRDILTAISISVALFTPWFLYLYWRTGYFLPTSIIGKRFTFSIGLDYIAAQNPYLSRLIQFRSFTYPLAWFIYLLVFALGGKSLPPPYITQGNVPEILLRYGPSYWAAPAWLLIILPLLFAAGKWFFNRQKWTHWIKDSNAQPLITLAAWLVLHNLTYMFLMPIPGTASRYGALNHVALWLLLAIGLARFAHRPYLARGMAGGLLLIAVTNNLYWNKVYDSNLEHMRTVRIATARYIRDTAAADDQCAASDIGAVRYFSGKAIVDLGALIDPGERRWFSEQKVDLYLLEKGVTCLILPGQMNASNEGWFDFVKIMGLNDSPYFKIQQIAVFEMDYDRWLLGYLPTNNQQKSVVIYKIMPTDQASP